MVLQIFFRICHIQMEDFRAIDDGSNENSTKNS